MAAGLRRRMPWLGTCGPALLLGDLLAVAATGLVARLLDRPGVLPPDRDSLLTAAALVVGTTWATGVHTPRLVLTVGRDLPALLVTALLAGVVLRSPTAVVLLLTLLCLTHWATYAVTRSLRRAGRLRHAVLVLGTGAPARRVAVELELRPDVGAHPVGFVSAGDADSPRGLPLARVGPVRLLPQLVAERGAEGLVLAAGDDEPELVAAAREWVRTGGLLWATLPERPAALPPAGPVERIETTELVRLGAVIRPLRALHAVLDGFVALVAIVLLVPLALVVAGLVRLETRSTAVINRPVVEADGQVTSTPRFRTRRARSLAREGTTWSVDIPGRVGPIGWALRHTGLDRLPEVLAGLGARVRPRPRPGRPAPHAGSANPASTDQTEVDAGQLTS